MSENLEGQVRVPGSEPPPPRSEPPPPPPPPDWEGPYPPSPNRQLDKLGKAGPDVTRRHSTDPRDDDALIDKLGKAGPDASPRSEEEERKATRDHVARRLDLTYPDGTPLPRESVEHALRSIDAEVVATLGDLLKAQEAGGLIEPGKLERAKLLAEGVQKERSFQELRSAIAADDERRRENAHRGDFLRPGGNALMERARQRKDYEVQSKVVEALEEFPVGTRPPESAEPQTPSEPSEKPKE